MSRLYLGGLLDPASGGRTGDRLEIESHELTTHGVIVGMTGSGKTGLGIVLLEEALLAGIPALILDPKGDIGNLLLNFPALRAEDFRPWIDEGEARRAGVAPDEHAAAAAERWRRGLADWEIGPDRMRALGTGAAFLIHTPGSTAGVPLDIVGSLAAPKLDWSTHSETMRDEIQGFVASLLGLAGIDADPLGSPAFILLANVIEHAWRQGADLDLATLIARVQAPPMRKLGVFDIDAFCPPKDRTALALRLNGLVASPSFAGWRQGPPLDIERMLWTPDRLPRAAILYLAHLSDAERQFVVTLVLSRLVTWMRTQPGTSSLRALVYMDEIFGFAPPTAEPPSKKPILTLFKQARAHGVGLVVATQNPVDLDYKAMSNAGTWMIGRLQTERDKARIVEGLRSATGAVDVADWDRRIGGLDKRQFLLRTTRSAEPALFTTRWAMSFLRGPLTKDEVGRLMADAPEREHVPFATSAPGAERELAKDESPVQPESAARVPVRFLDPSAPWASAAGAMPDGRRLEAAVVARVRLRFDEEKAGFEVDEEYEAVFHPLAESFDPATARLVDYDERDFSEAPPPGAVFVLPRAPIDQSSWWRDARSRLEDHLYRNRTRQILGHRELGVYARVGEPEVEFRARVRAAAEDAADAETAKLTERYGTRIERAKDAIASAERRSRELEVDVGQRKQHEFLAGAGELLGSLLGGRMRARSLGGLASRRSMTRRTTERLRTAVDRHDDALEDLARLEDELAAEMALINDRWATATDAIETLDVTLEKNDIRLDDLSLLWLPVA